MIGALVAGGAIVLGALLYASRRRWTVVAVSGPSMEPALRHGDRVIVRRIGLNRVRPGQIVVFRHPPPWRGVGGWRDGLLLPEEGHWSKDGPPPRPQWTIKRVVAVPGDPLPAELAAYTAELGATVPAGNLAVLGDNRPHSIDSRRFGYVPAVDVLGVLDT